MKKIILIFLISSLTKSYSQDFDVIYYMDYSFYLHNIDRGYNGTKNGFINKKGEIIEEAIFSDGVNNINGIANVTKDSVPGYIDKKNKLKLFPQFIKAFWNGKIGYAVDKNKKYALIDMNGNKITDFKYKLLHQTSEEYIAVSENDKIKNYIDTKGKIIFNDSIKMTDEGIFNSTGVYAKKNKFGLINVNGKIITEPIYDAIYGDKDYKGWLVKKNNKYGIINCDGKEFLPILYDKVNHLANEKDLIPVKMGDKYGYIQYSKEIIPFIYDEALPFRKGIARVKKEGKYHFIDTQNKIICSYESENPGWLGKDFFSNGLSIFKKNGKYGYINIKGEIVIEPVYEKANNFKEGIALVEKDGFYGFINPKGEIVIPIKYDYLSDIFDGRIMFGIK